VVGFVLARVRAHRLLTASALLTVVLAASVLATLTAFAGATGDAGLRHALERTSSARTVLGVRDGDVTSRTLPARDRAVRRAAHGAFGGLPVTTDTVLHSGPYALPRALRPADAEPADDPDLTLLVSLDPGRVRLTEGRWPAEPPRGGPGSAVVLPAALPVTAAERLGLRTGDRLALRARTDGDPPVTAEVTGLYAPRDHDDPYWRMDPLDGEGVRTLAFTTYGPLAVAPEVFTGGRLEPAAALWQTDADFTSVTAGGAPALGERVRKAVARFDRTVGAGSTVAESELPALLEALRRGLLVGSSTLLVAGLQLALLAGLTLLLVARLLAAERAGQTALLRARGASRARLAALAAAEALLLVLPGALCAPLLAVPAVRWLTGRAFADGAATGAVDASPAAAWWVAAGTALACAVTVVLPVLRAGTGDTVVPRRRRAAVALRGGLDVALLLLAGLACWQLRGRADGGVLTSSGDGPGVDPVLVAAPALALLAGTVLALRLLPALARLGERRAARGRGLTAALAGWQLGRRPGRGAGPAALLVLAVATGVLAVGQGASWDRSQGDQAAFRTGADVAVGGSSAPPFGQGGLFEGVEGIEAVAPVARSTLTVRGETSAEVLATDTRAAARGLLHLRGDLAAGPLPGLLRPLPLKDGDAGGVLLPEDTRALRLTARLEGGGPGTAAGDALTVTVEDRFGVPYDFPLGDLPADGQAHPRLVRLDAAAGGTAGAPAGPLRLTRVTLSYLAPPDPLDRVLDVAGLEAVGRDGAVRPVAVPRAPGWSGAVQAEDTDGVFGSGRYEAPRVGRLTGGAERLLSARFTTGSAPVPVPFEAEPVPVDLVLTARPPVRGDGPVLSGVATDAYLAAAGARVGDTVRAEVAGTVLRVRVTGALRALPTTGAGETRGAGGALLLDLAAVDRALQLRGGDPLHPNGWWVDAAPGAEDAVADALRAHPSLDEVTSRGGTAAALRADPLGSGPRTALTAVAAAATVLAAAGFAVGAAGTVRERRGEFAVLRALGAPRRAPVKVLAVEQGVLVALALAVGLALGTLLTRLVVPMVVLTGEATRPVPELLVRVPAGSVALLAAAVAAVPLLVVAAAVLRGGDAPDALRTGRED
jgi:hypothetical protein